MVDASLANLGGLWGGSPDQGALWNALTNNGQWRDPQMDASAAVADPASTPAPQSHGLLGQLAGGVQHALGGLLGGNHGAPSAQASAAQQPTADPMAAFMNKLQSTWGQVTQEAFASGVSRSQARQNLIQRNMQMAMLPYQMQQMQQRIQYGQSIQDPALRELFFNAPETYNKIMGDRMGVHDTAGGATTTGLGANGDQSVFGSVVSKPGEVVGNTAGQVFQRNKSALITLGPSQSAADGDTAKILSTAPAAPQVVDTAPGHTTSFVTPGQPGAPAGSGPTFDLSQVQKDPTAFFGGVFGKPVTISSGARTPQQNAAVGGVPNSAHLSDQAWDIPNLGMSAQGVAASLKAAGVPFDQVIDEGDHTHVSLAPKARGMVLVGRNGNYQVVSSGSGTQAPRGPSVQTITQGSTPHQLVTPQERAAAGIQASDRAGYARNPDGSIVKTADDDFGPEKQAAYTKNVLEFEPLKNYITTRGFLDAAQKSMQQKGGFADLNLIDMAGKSVNPTLAMRPNMIEQFGKERGWPDAVIGQVRGALEHGQALDGPARNALYNTIYTNTQAHYNAAKGMINKVNRDATKYGLTAQDLIPDLMDMPEAPKPSYGGRGGAPQPQAPSPAPQRAPSPNGVNAQQALAAARDAIRRGAKRADVVARLQQNGINPAGL